MDEQLYDVQQYFTQGWEVVGSGMSTEEATKRLEALIAEGFYPGDLRVRKAA